MKDDQFIKIRESFGIVQFELFQKGKEHIDKHPDYILPYIWREPSKHAVVELKEWELVEIIAKEDFLVFFEGFQNQAMRTMESM